LIGVTALWFSPQARAAQPVIEAGRNSEIVALFAPTKLGDDIAPEWKLWGVAVHPTHVSVTAKHGAAIVPLFDLLHIDSGPPGSRTSRNFAIVPTYPAEPLSAMTAAAELMSAVERNDEGTFWKVERELPTLPQPGVVQLVTRNSQAWFTDGLVLFAILFVVLVSLTARQLRRAPRWMPWALLGIVGAGAALRFWLAPFTALGVAPFSETDAATQALFQGPGLATLQTRWGQPLRLVDVTAWTTFAFSVLTPLAAFVCGRALTRRPAVGLAAAAFIAVLPVHIRFGLSDLGLVSSVMLAALAVALACVALDDEARAWRWAGLFLFPIAAAAALFVRPLAAIVLIVIAAVALYERAGAASVARRLVVTAIAASVALAVYSVDPGLLGLAASHGANSSAHSLDPLIVVRAFAIAANPLENTLINPLVTPLALLVLALLGVLVLWEIQRRLAIVLICWIALYFICQAYVDPRNIYTQSREHLQLIIPFLLLSAAGLCALASGLKPKVRRIAIPAVVILIAASPLVHARFISDVNFNRQREFDFVREASASVPEDCTVLEHVEPGRRGARFARMGTVLDNWKVYSKFRVIPINASADSEETDTALTPEAQAVLNEPPECLYYFEGLPCWEQNTSDQPIAPACGAIHEALRLEPVARDLGENRPYDWDAERALPQGIESLGYVLYRARPFERN